MMKLHSSLIHSYSYFRDRQTLCLRFTNGRTYAYSEITIDDCYLFLDAASKGVHFNLYIRGKKPYTEITDALKAGAGLPDVGRLCYNAPLRESMVKHG